MKHPKLLRLSLTAGVALGLLGLCQFGSSIESNARMASQFEAQNHLRVVYDLEEVSTPWCILALMEGKDNATGGIDWKAGEIIQLGDYQFYDLGYGSTYPEGELTVEYRGENYELKPRYAEPSAGMYNANPGVERLEVERTCRNVEIMVK